jgi:hypothetical protein
VRLVQSSALTAELRKRGRARVLENFTQKKMAERVWTLCSSVVENRENLITKKRTSLVAS